MKPKTKTNLIDIWLHLMQKLIPLKDREIEIECEKLKTNRLEYPQQNDMPV